MESLLYMAYKIEPIFYKIVYMSLIASLIGIVIIILRQVFRKQISPKWISRIWLIFIISLIIPIGIKTHFSIYNLIPNNLTSIQEISFSKDKYHNLNSLGESIKSSGELIIKENSDSDLEKIVETSSNPEESNKLEENIKNNNTTENINKNQYSIKYFLPLIWFTIVITMLFSYILAYIVFEFEISKFDMQDIILNNILFKAKEKIGIKRKIKLVEQNLINMPSLFGIFNVRILLNRTILTQTDKEIEYIFLHELAHYKRKDNVLNILITILRCIYFFNPIVWLLLNQIKKDMELGADELAMLNSSKEEQKEYCKTLVKISTLTPDLFLIQTMCLSENKKILERRIEMMKLSEKFKKRKGIIAIISIIIMILLVVVFYTRSNNEMTYDDIVDLMNLRDNYNNVYYEIEVKSNKDENIEKFQNYWKDGILYSKSENLISYNDFNKNEYISINNLYKEIQITNVGNENNRFNNLYEAELNYKDIFFNYNYLGEIELNNTKAYKVEIKAQDNSEIRTFYIDKYTGFVIQFELYTNENNLKTVIKYNYKIDAVLDTDIIKPNLAEYQDYTIK